MKIFGEMTQMTHDFFSETGKLNYVRKFNEAFNNTPVSEICNIFATEWDISIL